MSVAGGQGWDLWCDRELRAGTSGVTGGQVWDCWCDRGEGQVAGLICLYLVTIYRKLLPVAACAVV